MYWFPALLKVFLDRARDEDDPTESWTRVTPHMARSSSHPAGRKRTGKRRTLKIFLVGLAVLLLLLVLNAFALDRETGSASLNVDGAKLVSTTSGDI